MCACVYAFVRYVCLIKNEALFLNYGSTRKESNTGRRGE